MPVHRIESTATHIRLWKSSDVADRKEIDVVAELTKQGGDNAKVAAFIKAELQASIDVVIPRKDLPKEDEAAKSNPNRPDFFWDGPNLVARPVIVESVVWDGTRYVSTLRRAR